MVEERFIERCEEGAWGRLLVTVAGGVDRGWAWMDNDRGMQRRAEAEDTIAGAEVGWMTMGSWSAEQKRRIQQQVRRWALRGMGGSGCWRGEVTTGASSVDRGAEMEVKAASAEASVARHAGGRGCIWRVDFEKMKGDICKILTRDGRQNWCFKNSRDIDIIILYYFGLQVYGGFFFVISADRREAQGARVSYGWGPQGERAQHV